MASSDLRDKYQSGDDSVVGGNFPDSHARRRQHGSIVLHADATQQRDVHPAVPQLIDGSGTGGDDQGARDMSIEAKLEFDEQKYADYQLGDSISHNMRSVGRVANDSLETMSPALAFTLVERFVSIPISDEEAGESWKQLQKEVNDKVTELRNARIKSIFGGQKPEQTGHSSGKILICAYYLADGHEYEVCKVEASQLGEQLMAAEVRGFPLTDPEPWPEAIGRLYSLPFNQNSNHESGLIWAKDGEEIRQKSSDKQGEQALIVARELQKHADSLLHLLEAKENIRCPEGDSQTEFHDMSTSANRCWITSEAGSMFEGFGEVNDSGERPEDSGTRRICGNQRQSPSALVQQSNKGTMTDQNAQSHLHRQIGSCSFCRKKGHSVNQCYVKMRHMGLPVPETLQCPKCKKVGRHYSADCSKFSTPAPRPNQVPQRQCTSLCFRCQGQGHIARNCSGKWKGNQKEKL